MDHSNPVIQTVRSRIPANELGYCQSHEHIFIADGQSAKLSPALRLDDFNKTVLELHRYMKSGGASLVDAQPVGCGRMADSLYKASIRTNANIIASTGFHKLVFYPEDHWIRTMDEDKLINLYKSEIETGMYIDCDNSLPTHRIASRAGVIKTASDISGPAGEYSRLFSAAAEASRETGTPILSHTEMGKGALEQIKLFKDHLVPVSSMILCHLDRDLSDMGYILEVAGTGVYLEFDTIGRFRYHSDEEEAEFILKMVEKGYEDRILIGLDTTRDRLRSYGGTIGLDYMITTFIPLLRSVGLTDDSISKFTVGNPAKAFAIKYTNQKETCNYRQEPHNRQFTLLGSPQPSRRS